MSGLYVAARGCSGCPYRGTCHEARQRVQDAAVETGRHYECGFYRSILASLSRQALRPSWWRRLWGAR